MQINPTSIVKTISKIDPTKSVRKIFYNGPTTLDDMTLDRMQATIYDAVRFSAKPYQKLSAPFRFLMGIKRPDEIAKGLIPRVESAFRMMPKKVYNKLQKALVIIENPKNVKPKLYQNACDYYNEIADSVLNRVVYK